MQILNRLEVAALRALNWEFRFHRGQWEKWLDDLIRDHMSPARVSSPQQDVERNARVLLLPVVKFYKQALSKHPEHGGKGIVFIP